MVTRDLILRQEIARINDKVDHYWQRICRGSADAEDKAAYQLYARIKDALASLERHSPDEETAPTTGGATRI